MILGTASGERNIGATVAPAEAGDISLAAPGSAKDRRNCLSPIGEEG